VVAGVPGRTIVFRIDAPGTARLGIAAAAICDLAHVVPLTIRDTILRTDLPCGAREIHEQRDESEEQDATTGILRHGIAS
jgi:hypothetical protein